MLDTIIAAGETAIHFWRDKQGREVDFVLPRGRQGVDAIECKWNPKSFEPTALRAFRERYPLGKNYVVSPIEGEPYGRSVGGFEVTFTSPTELRKGGTHRSHRSR